MHHVAQLASDWLMLVLSVVAVPTDTKEFRLDIIQHSGNVETLVVKRTDAGFSLLQEQEDKLIERGTLEPAPAGKDVYLLKMNNMPEQTIDLSASVSDFSLAALRKDAKLTLHEKEGNAIQVARSGATVYLISEQGQTTLACH